MNNKGNDIENALVIEAEQLMTLRDIVDNLPLNSFVMPEESSMYDGGCNVILDEKAYFIEPLLKCFDDFAIDPSCSVVISAEVFHVNGKEARKDLLLKCYSVGNWKLSMKLLDGRSSRAIAFLSKKFENTGKMGEPDEIEITPEVAELFLKISDILLLKSKKTYSTMYKCANLSD